MTKPDTLAGLRTAEEFQALLDAAVDGIILIDHQGKVQAFNRAAERLFGYRAEEILGANISVLMPNGDHNDHVIGRGREVEARRRDGSVFPVFLSVGVVEGTEPPRFVSFIQDISYRRRAEEEAHRLQDRLTHVSRLATVGEMSAGIAHELNQPLTAVANYAQACDRLLGMPDPDIEEIRAALQQITAQAVRAGDIIRRLRTLARNDVLKRESTDINPLIDELSDLIQLDAKAHNVQYELDLSATVPPVHADRAQVQQVILNLVRNALEALSESSSSPRRVAVRTRRLPEGDAEIAVCDNGPGISPAILRHLFDPFCTTKPHGTGLGLAISRTIIKSHQGTLEYTPNLPRGACFTIRLPGSVE